MSKVASIAAIAAGLVTSTVSDQVYAPSFRMPVSDWEHSDERVRKAEEKRAMKAAKRRAAMEGKS